MRLSDFILRDIDQIIGEWEKFAAGRLPAGEQMSSLALRDHAEQILRAIAKDISQPQTADEQATKSLGDAPLIAGASETAAETHGLLRAKSGFDIKQMTSEYRALRASVMRLWMEASTGPPDLNDLMRFNEAIDQALAESVSFYSESVDRSRNLFLGMLEHDMRTPLQVMKTTATYLDKIDAGPEVAKAASRMIASGARMQALLDDLVGFNRINLGLGIPLNRVPCDFGQLCADELALIQILHPKKCIELLQSGSTIGYFDGPWVHRLIRNLTVNAIKYGFENTPVRIVVKGQQEHVLVEVHNEGVPIEPSVLGSLFDPLRRGMHNQDRNQEAQDGLGLGLYIAREVATAHGGEILARSDGNETVFTIKLPRETPSADV